MKGLISLPLFGIYLVSVTAFADGLCPTEADKTRYFVTPVKIQDASEQTIRGAMGSPIPLAAVTDAQKQTPAPEQSLEAEVIDGLAQFIQQRAKLELEDWATNEILTTLCTNDDKTTNGLFPETCRLKQLPDNSPGVLTDSYTKLVSAVRSDVESLPACLVYQNASADYGYRLMALYHENANGTSIEELVNGLLQSGDLNPLPYPNPGGDTHGVNCRYSPAAAAGTPKFDKPTCSVLVPLIAYTAVLQSRDRQPSTADAGDAAKTKLWVQAFAYAVMDLSNKNNLPELAATAKQWGSNLAPAQVQYASNTLAAIINIREQADSATLALKKIKSSERSAVAEKLTTIQEFVSQQILASTKVGFITDETTLAQLDSDLGLMATMMGTYSAIQAHEYSVAIENLSPLLSCLGNDAASNHPAWCMLDKQNYPLTAQSLATTQKILSGAAALADAKSSDDFATTLDSLASPAGSWRRGHNAGTLSITAYGGIRTGADSYNVPGYGQVNGNSEVVVFAPVGVSFTHPLAGNWDWGLFASILDLGNIVNQPSDVTFPKGKITGNVQSKLSYVFTPGIFVTVAPFKNAPFSFGFGWTHGPSAFRQATLSKGPTEQVSRGTVFSVFIGVEIPMFPLN